MNFKKYLNRQMWPVKCKLEKKKKLEIFLENVSVLNDFIDILTPIEFHIIYLKVTHEQIAFSELAENLNSYRRMGALKTVIANDDEVSIKMVSKIYNSGINKILDLVEFEFNDYSLEIIYEGKGKNKETKRFPKLRVPRENKSWYPDSVAKCKPKTIEQIEKIKSNKVLEQQNKSIYPGQTSQILKAQEEALQRMKDQDDD